MRIATKPLTAVEQNILAKYGAEYCIAAYERTMRFHARRPGGIGSTFPAHSAISLVGRKLKEGR